MFLVKIRLWKKSGANTGFKWRAARFISEQKHPDLGTFFKVDIFPVLH